MQVCRTEGLPGEAISLLRAVVDPMVVVERGGCCRTGLKNFNFKNFNFKNFKMIYTADYIKHKAGRPCSVM